MGISEADKRSSSSRLLPTGALRTGCMKKGSLQGDEMRPSLASKSNSREPQVSPKSSCGLCTPADSDLNGRVWFLQRFCVRSGVVPSAPHPHAAQTVGATAGLEANKARRNGAQVPCSAAAG
ncbi:hypothetical protein CHARACLAT_013233 [Characodon lateralis]|uniref:Uncharacterized protein n=1 Tax=Characodon lateralis TaxID=208331 RepID=A0ABU7CMU3_9TELE|nr:hypothetical protein [Characodon lateralis]